MFVDLDAVVICDLLKLIHSSLELIEMLTLLSSKLVRFLNLIFEVNDLLLHIGNTLCCIVDLS
jgi:hypothetical protein